MYVYVLPFPLTAARIIVEQYQNKIIPENTYSLMKSHPCMNSSQFYHQQLKLERPDPEAVAIDTFSIPWTGLKFYAFPYF